MNGLDELNEPNELNDMDELNELNEPNALHSLVSPELSAATIGDRLFDDLHGSILTREERKRGSSDQIQE